MNIKTKLILRERKVRLAFFVLLNLTVGALILFVPNVLVASVLAIVFFYLTNPVVDMLEHLGLSRSLATTLPFVVFTISAGVAASVFVPQLVAQLNILNENLPTILEKARLVISNLKHDQIPIIEPAMAEKLLQQGLNFFIEQGNRALSQIPNIISSSITTLLLAPFFTYFALLDGKTVYRRFLQLVPNNVFELVVSINHQIHQQLGQFIRVRLLESLIVGLILQTAFTYIDLPYRLLLSVIAALLNLIPYLGPIIGAIPGLLLCLTNEELTIHFKYVLGAYILAQIVDALILVPVMVAKVMKMHPIIVILAVILGAEIMGILGMIVSIPVVGALMVFFTAIYKHLTNVRS